MKHAMKTQKSKSALSIKNIRDKKKTKAFIQRHKFMRKKNKNNKQGYSIIIPAYKSENFLEECLDSIVQQTHFINNDRYEILLGIDSCKITLQKVKNIRHKYKKLRVFYFKKNNGPYIVKNSLIPIAKYDLLLFFDSDDHMERYMISNIDNRMKRGYDICKLKYYNYKNGESPTSGIIKPKVADGVGCHKKRVHDILGGFEEWKCGADSDFCFRSEKLFKIAHIGSPSFFRRVHPNSLTQKNDTNPSSPTRTRYAQEIKNRQNTNYYDTIRKVEIRQREFEEIE